MMDFAQFDRRRTIVAIAGPNGAGKTTFFHAHLASGGLRFVNPDALAAQLDIDSYQAARVAAALRRELVAQGESFVFETVFSDPVGDKVAFLDKAVRKGYLVILCYIGLASAVESRTRVAMRVLQGGHDVPDEKIASRFSRTLDNLRRAISQLPHVLVFDNSDMRESFRRVAVFEHGRATDLQEPLPDWLQELIRSI